MSDDKCFPEGTEIPYRGAAPPQAYEVIGTTKPPFSIELPFDDSFLNLPDAVYEGGMTLEEKLAELEGTVNDEV